MKSLKTASILTLLVIFFCGILLTGCGSNSKDSAKAFEKTIAKENITGKQLIAQEANRQTTPSEEAVQTVQNQLYFQNALTAVLKESAAAQEETESRKEVQAQKETQTQKTETQTQKTEAQKTETQKTETAAQKTETKPQQAETKPQAQKPVAAAGTPAGHGLTAHQQTLLNRRLVENINNLRASVGAAPLTLVSSLIDIAVVRSEEASYCWSHTRPDGTRGCNMIPSSKWRGENLSKVRTTGFEGTDDQINALADRIFNNWVASSGHYANLISTNYTCIGLFTHYAQEKGVHTLTTAAMFSN